MAQEYIKTKEFSTRSTHLKIVLVQRCCIGLLIINDIHTFYT